MKVCKIRIIILTIVMLIGYATANATTFTEEEFTKELVGCWNAEPCESSGLTDNMNFYADGTYRFVYNEMDHFKSRFFENGEWEIKDDCLIIAITSQEVRDTTKILFEYGQYKLENLKLNTEIIDPPRISKIPLSKLNMRYDGEVTRMQNGQESNILTMDWGVEQFWRLEPFPVPKTLDDEEWDAYFDLLDYYRLGIAHVE